MEVGVGVARAVAAELAREAPAEVAREVALAMGVEVGREAVAEVAGVYRRAANLGEYHVWSSSIVVQVSRSP